MKYLRCAVVLLMMLSMAACSRNTVPKEIAGTWRTDDARYQNKLLQFDESYAVLGLGEEFTPKAARIEKMTVTREAGVITCAMRLRDQEGQATNLTVLYSPVNGGELRLSNPRQVIWHRDSTDATAGGADADPSK